LSPFNPPSHRRRLLAGLAIALLVVAGCNSTRPSPTPTSTTNHDLHAYPDLEERIDISISGRRLTTVSLAAHPDRQDPKTLAVLERLERTAADLQLANGDLGDLGDLDLEVGAMRIVGASGDQIIAAFRAVDEADPNHRALYTPTTIGERSVTARTVDTESSFLYGAEDIMFILRGDLALVEAALEQLPQ
jgi:hypothetical protein